MASLIMTCFFALEGVALEHHRTIAQFRVHPKYVAEVTKELHDTITLTAMYYDKTGDKVLAILGHPVILDHNVDGIEAILEK